MFVRPAHRDPSHQLQQWACETEYWLYCPRREDPQTLEEVRDEAPLVTLRNFTSVSPIACPGQGWVEPRIKGPESPPGARTAFPQPAGPGTSQLQTLRLPPLQAHPTELQRKREWRQEKRGRKEHAETSWKIKGGQFPHIKPVIRLRIKLKHSAFHLQSAILRLIRLY